MHFGENFWNAKAVLLHACLRSRLVKTAVQMSYSYPYGCDCRMLSDAGSCKEGFAHTDDPASKQGRGEPEDLTGKGENPKI